MDSKSSTAIPMEPHALCRGGGEDRISGLPDELLHLIFGGLPTAAAAARTSVLSRRWRGVWAHMPELVLGGGPASATTPSTLLDSIDAALESYAAPTLCSLKIDLFGVPAHRISTWLRFASQRVAGKLRIRLYRMNGAQRYGNIKDVLLLPICARATEIDLHIVTCNVFLRVPPTGSFTLLIYLKISCAQMDGGELGRAVSSLQCPRLRKLHLFVVKFEPVRDISISSDSLQCLHLSSSTGKLEVTAPMLQDIIMSSAVEACLVVAPKLEKVAWFNTYDPCAHKFVVAERHLRSLSIMHSVTSSTRLMERFDTTTELTLYLGCHKWLGIEGYTTFLKELEKLPICETLVIDLTTIYHAFARMVFHFLRRCSCIRKFKLIFKCYTPSEFLPCTMADCPCHLLEKYRLDDVTFDSLEEIVITFFRGSAEQVEFVELLLSRCNRVNTLKRVNFLVPSVSSGIMEVVQMIRSKCHPKSKAQFNVNCREVPQP